MKNAAHARNPAPRRPQGVQRIVRTLDEARSLYVQSVTRIDLATVARTFATAPETVEVSGRLPKTK